MLGLMGFSGSLPLYVIHRYYIFVFIDRANKDACLLGLAEGFPVILRTIFQTFFIEVRLLILDTKDCQDLRLVDFIVRLVLAWVIRRFSILAKVVHVFIFRVAFLLLRMEFIHSSFSQTGSRFLDRSLLLGIVLLAFPLSKSS